MLRTVQFPVRDWCHYGHRRVPRDWNITCYTCLTIIYSTVSLLHEMDQNVEAPTNSHVYGSGFLPANSVSYFFSFRTLTRFVVENNVFSHTILTHIISGTQWKQNKNILASITGPGEKKIVHFSNDDRPTSESKNFYRSLNKRRDTTYGGNEASIVSVNPQVANACTICVTQWPVWCCLT